jgi:DNA-binding response OmpR family regulator
MAADSAKLDRTSGLAEEGYELRRLMDPGISERARMMNRLSDSELLMIAAMPGPPLPAHILRRIEKLLERQIAGPPEPAPPLPKPAPPATPPAIPPQAKTLEEPNMKIELNPREISLLRLALSTTRDVFRRDRCAAEQAGEVQKAGDAADARGTKRMKGTWIEN